MAGTRNILFVCTDQQRFDSLGCNGNVVARTPVIDGLAANGLNYHRAHNQNVICMPSRASIITGQLVRTHGVYASGVALPGDAPSVAASLEAGGYRTALIGKAHFEPILEQDPPVFEENRMALEDRTGPYRGFEHVELALHLPAYLGRPAQHWGMWLHRSHPEQAAQFPRRHFDTERLASATGAPDTSAANEMPRELYHTDWLADHAIEWLRSLGRDEPWFLYLSFPDPHHPLNPPRGELGRIDWKSVDLPASYPGSTDRAVEILSQKPRHWLKNYLSTRGPRPPSTLTADQLREMIAMTCIENELIDEAVGRVLQTVAQRGDDERTDVFFTTDHGDLLGDFGMVFKGPYHVDGLMRVPLIWRPAPVAGVEPAVIEEPVGLLDLAPTWCEIAGVPVPKASRSPRRRTRAANA